MKEEEIVFSQSPTTVAQFASLLVISALLNEIAESDGKINVDRLIARIKTQPNDVKNSYPDSIKLMGSMIADMESRRVK